MLSAYDLPIEERDQIMSTLNSEQAAFLNETMTRGRRTVFARIMAGQKGSNIPENATYEEIERLVEDWIYINYVDAGAVSDHLKCECGRSLRYQHTVQNKTTGQTHKFGITHLEMHTGIDAKIVNHIVHGFQTIDFELYEILFKVKNGWNLQQGIGFIPPAFLFPEDVQRHLDLDVPLLDRQINRVRRLIRVFQSSVPPIVKKIERKTDSGQPNVAFEGDQSVMNLFVDDSPQSSINALTEGGSFTSTVAGDPMKLSPHLQEPVLQYLKSGMNSIVMICEMLIRLHGASDKRFSTGKPELYVPVCVYVDDLVHSGECQLISREPHDRLYKWE